jgi:hypothetical protein
MPLKVFYIRLKYIFRLRFSHSWMLILTFISLAGLSNHPVNALQSGSSFTTYSNNPAVYLYYFFFTPRCEECMILEKALLQVLNEHYTQELKSKKLNFKMVNLSDPDAESRKIIQDLRVRRQLLLLVSGDTIINLTKDAFRYAENQHERFTEYMTNAIDQVLSPQNARIQNYKSDLQKTCMWWSAEVPGYSGKEADR